MEEDDLMPKGYVLMYDVKKKDEDAAWTANENLTFWVDTVHSDRNIPSFVK